MASAGEQQQMSAPLVNTALLVEYLKRHDNFTPESLPAGSRPLSAETQVLFPDFSVSSVMFNTSSSHVDEEDASSISFRTATPTLLSAADAHSAQLSARWQTVQRLVHSGSSGGQPVSSPIAAPDASVASSLGPAATLMNWDALSASHRQSSASHSPRGNVLLQASGSPRTTARPPRPAVSPRGVPTSSPAPAVRIASPVKHHQSGPYHHGGAAIVSPQKVKASPFPFGALEMYREKLDARQRDHSARRALLEEHMLGTSASSLSMGGTSRGSPQRVASPARRTSREAVIDQLRALRRDVRTMVEETSSKKSATRRRR